MGLFDKRNKAEEVYFNTEWSGRRLEATKHLAWYDGSAIRDRMSTTPDEGTGQPVPLYPIAENIIGPEVRIHQALTIGSLPDYNNSPIEIRFRTEGESKTEVDKLRQVFRKILRDSDAPSKFTHAATMSQIDGGMVFKVNWEPYSDFLKYRVRWLFYRPHLIMPVWNQYDHWRLEECYLGWEITSEDAKNHYGISVEKGKDRVVYLEHWDKKSYKITVDGQVPTDTEYGELAGDHGLGRVPFIYIPHWRTDFWGMSHVPDLTGITVEVNERKADMGDAIADITHPDMFVTDVRKAGGVKLTYLIDEQHHSRPVWDLGDTGSLPGSKTPALGYVKHEDIPESVSHFTDGLLADAHWNADLPLSATGKEHYTSGRITGVGTQNMMGQILYHTQQERVDFSEGVRHLVDVTLRMLQAHRSDYEKLGVDAPVITDEHFDLETLTLWNPQLPMEADKEAEMINADVTTGTASIEAALIRKHVPDPLEEKAKIEADMKYANDLAIELAKATAAAKQSAFTQGA